MSVVFFSLGNPGAMARHSVGHLMLKSLVSEFGAPQLVKKSKYSVSSIEDVYFVRSNSYMNESGLLLRAFLSGEKLRNYVLVVLYDDFEIDMPRVRLLHLKAKESHNGLRSIVSVAQGKSEKFFKLGVGIGPKPALASLAVMGKWVLSDFSINEKVMVQKSLETGQVYARHIVQTGGDVGDTGKLNAKMTKSSSESSSLWG